MLDRVKAHVKGKSPSELRSEFDSFNSENLNNGISVKVFLENNGYTFEEEESKAFRESDYYELYLKALLETELSFFNNFHLCI